jgi:hypothetical protein
MRAKICMSRRSGHDSRFAGDSSSSRSEDRSACGKVGNVPCQTKPFCGPGQQASEEGLCIVCGDEAGAVPCEHAPYCQGRLIGMMGGSMLDFCEACGSVNKPPCGDKLAGKPCDDGLFRTSVALLGDARVAAKGQESVCTSESLAGQCGFVGQESCEGVCRGRSTTSEDGQTCEECGGAGQGTCDGLNQAACDAGLVVQEQGDLQPVCVCAKGVSSCSTSSNSPSTFHQSSGGAKPVLSSRPPRGRGLANAATVSDSPAAEPGTSYPALAPESAALLESVVSDPYGLGPPADAPSAGLPPNTGRCGERGQVACQDAPHCEPRLIIDENSRCALPGGC